MCIYCGTNKYRKIYENHIGPIPKEANGRSYEIHHKDNNHNNNDPANLVAVTIQEHYDIHFSQGDYNACKLIKLQRMDKDPVGLSNLSRLNNAKLVAEGKHPFQDREWAKARTRKQIDNGTHNFLGGEITRKTNKRRLENGTHQFLDGARSKEVQTRLVKEGTHCLLGGQIQRESNAKRIADGTHHLLGPNSPTQVEWVCPGCGKAGKGKSNFSRWHSNC